MPNISTRYKVDPTTGDLITPNRTLINLSGEEILFKGTVTQARDVVISIDDPECAYVSMHIERPSIFYSPAYFDYNAWPVGTCFSPVSINNGGTTEMSIQANCARDGTARTLNIRACVFRSVQSPQTSIWGITDVSVWDQTTVTIRKIFPVNLANTYTKGEVDARTEPVIVSGGIVGMGTAHPTNVICAQLGNFVDLAFNCQMIRGFTAAEAVNIAYVQTVGLPKYDTVGVISDVANVSFQTGISNAGVIWISTPADQGNTAWVFDLLFRYYTDTTLTTAQIVSPLNMSVENTVPTNTQIG